MQLMNPFDATKFDPTQGVPSMPVGKHPVVIVDSEVAPTKDNTGGMLVLTLQIIDGPAKGQKGSYRLNLYNQSQQAVEIAHRQLSAICHAIGVFQVQDSQQLHNIPFVVEVTLQKSPEAAAKGYTEVSRVYDRNGNEPGKPVQGGPAQPAQGGGQWGGQPTAGQQQAPQGGAPAWGGQPAAGQPNPAQGQPAAGGGGNPGWGGQPQGNQPAQNNQPAQGGGWQQGGGNQGGGNAPWGQR